MVVWILGIVSLLVTLANAEESNLCDHITQKKHGGWNDIIIGVLDEHPLKGLSISNSHLDEIMICKPDPDHVNFTRAFQNSLYNFMRYTRQKDSDYDPKTGSLFWIDGNKIYQTLADGRMFGLLNGDLIKDVPDVSSLALHPTGDRLYFVAKHAIGYIKLDEPRIIRMVKNYTYSLPRFSLRSSIHVDNKNGYLFARFDDRVFRTRLDGSDKRTILYIGDENLEKINFISAKLDKLYLDRSSDRLYYSTSDGEIYSTNLDGGDMKLVEIESNNDRKTLLMVDYNYIYYGAEWPVLALRADKRTLVQDPDFELRDDRSGEKTKFKIIFMLKEPPTPVTPELLYKMNLKNKE